MMFGLGSKKTKKNRSFLSVALVASAAFIALAIYGWDLPVEKAANFLLITVVLLAAVIGSALAVVFVWHQLKKLFR